MLTSRLSRTLTAAALAVGFATASALTGAGSATAADNGKWSVSPAVIKGSEGSARQFVFLEARAGQTVRDAVLITNKTKAKKVFDVFAADAYNSQGQGAFGLTTIADTPRDLGSWITVTKPKVEVKAGKSVLVPITVAIPKTATPGDHAGGVVALDTDVSRGGGDNPNVRLDVQNGVGVRVYTRVSGPLTPQLTITNFKLDAEPKLTPFSAGTSKVTFTVKNTGNVRITPKATVTLTGMFGRTLGKVGPTAVNEVLPGGQVTLTTTVPASSSIGPVHAKLELTSPETTVSADATQWVFPWWLLILIVVAAVVGYLIWRKRRGKQPAADGPAPGGRRRRGSPVPAAPAGAASGAGYPGAGGQAG